MATMQEKILDRVRAAIEAEGLEALERRQFANTGWIDAVSGDFDVEFTLRYDFQDSYMSPDVSGPAVDRLIEEAGGVQVRTYPSKAIHEYIEVAGQEYRIQDSTGERGIALPLDMRKRYVKWYSLAYSGETIKPFLGFIEELAMYAVRHPAVQR